MCRLFDPVILHLVAYSKEIAKQREKTQGQGGYPQYWLYFEKTGNELMTDKGNQLHKFGFGYDLEYWPTTTNYIGDEYLLE